MKPDSNLPLTGQFWRAAAEGRLELPHCVACRRIIWYPRETCPHCGHKPRWHEISGRGTVAAFSVVHRPLFPDAVKWVPYVSALIAIEEDASIRLVSRIVDCEPARVRCDMPVQVAFRAVALPDGTEFIAPLFQPAEPRQNDSMDKQKARTHQ
jgi:uncharacterized OB-fold protein